MIARRSVEDYSQDDLLMKQRPRKDSRLSIPRYPVPDHTLVTVTAPAGFYSPVDIHWIHLSIDVHSCSLFAFLRAVRLHIVADEQKYSISHVAESFCSTLES